MQQFTPQRASVQRLVKRERRVAAIKQAATKTAGAIIGVGAFLAVYIVLVGFTA